MNQPPLFGATSAFICRRPIATASITAALSLDLQAMLPAWAPEHSRISPAIVVGLIAESGSPAATGERYGRQPHRRWRNERLVIAGSRWRDGISDRRTASTWTASSATQCNLGAVISDHGRTPTIPSDGRRSAQAGPERPIFSERY